MKLSLLATAALATAAGCLFTQQAAAQDAAVRVMASNGMKAALEELQPQCERSIGHSLALRFSSTAALKKRIEGGEGFDVTVIAAEAIADLIKEGKLASDSPRDVARSELGIGIRAGAARPDIRTPATLKLALREAKSITYPQDGATRSDIEKMFESLGIAAEVKPKIILAPSSGAATESVATGRVAFVLTLFSEIVPVAGTEILGPLPGAFQDAVHFQAAVSKAAKNGEASKMLVACLAGPLATPVYKTKGLTPAASSK
jgi:molybdate transport system substrate-binding protein